MVKSINSQYALTYAKRSGLRSMQNIEGTEREIINAYKNELTHDIWGNPDKLYDWAVRKFNELKNKNYISNKLSKEDVVCDRNEIVKEWATHIENNYYSKDNPFLRLKILKSVVSDLKENNTLLPPVINEEVISEAIKDVVRYGTSFKKAYFSIFKEFISVPGLKVDNVNEGIKGKWYSIQLPDYSVAHKKPGLFRKIKELITVLSQGSNWCTRNHKSISDIFLGNDFHIFIDNKGYPQLCIVGNDNYGGRFRYIKGNNQYKKIPEKYLPVLRDFLHKNNLEKSVVGEIDSELRPVINMFK